MGQPLEVNTRGASIPLYYYSLLINSARCVIFRFNTRAKHPQPHTRPVFQSICFLSPPPSLKNKRKTKNNSKGKDYVRRGFVSVYKFDTKFHVISLVFKFASATDWHDATPTGKSNQIKSFIENPILICLLHQMKH